MRMDKKRELLIVWISLGVIFLASLLYIFLSKPSQILTPEEQVLQEVSDTKEEQKDYSQDQSVEEEGSFPDNLLAPYVDMVSWVDTGSEYSINGVPNLQKLHEECGGEYYCLGFIRLDDNAPIADDGTLRWCWGGYYSLSEDGNDGFQYEGIKKSIQKLRDAGGDVVVSVGGQLGYAPWVYSDDVNALRDMYLDIIKTYDLERIDLDIEEANQDYAQNVINAKAVKKVQDRTGVEVVLTIPIMPYGWTSTQENIIRAYLGAGVDVKIFNSMTMCYGSEVNYGEDFAEASIRAIDNAHNQLINLYKEYGVNLSEEESYSKLGATVDIGYENVYNPVFTANMTQRVAEYAKEKNLAMYSFWSMNRDSMIQYNSAINSKYTHYDSALSYFDK